MSTSSLTTLTELQRAAFTAGLREVLQKQAFQEGFLEACVEEKIPVDQALDAALRLLRLFPLLSAQESPRRGVGLEVEPRDQIFVRENSQLAPPQEVRYAA